MNQNDYINIVNLTNERLINGKIIATDQEFGYWYSLKGPLLEDYNEQLVVVAVLIAEELNRHPNNFYYLGRNLRIYPNHKQRRIVVDFGLGFAL